MAVALSTSARQALIALMIHVSEASNPDLQNRFGVTIKKPDRDQLSDEKLIMWRKGARQAIFHELTDKGWARARAELTAEPPAKASPAWRLHYATLRNLDRLMQTLDYQLADVFVLAESAEDGLRRVYGELAEQAGDLVELAKVRGRLTGVPRAELDATLLDLSRRKQIHLDPDPNRRALTDDARAAAISVGGEDMHLIAIGAL
ncbi:hypothetical protein GCM10010172_79310 [Paractinoplanes ferrugineus]|uniref:Uncharacterized protein n=1 Tax=Paractinoplanes ferrugineus TaxID=113564 RepID=A0A919MHU5_9ACTN|nr:hypothetical protein [Actinoplanes ferrugineus]GIE13005.1 hypothetical protein Afe05nite_48450 [Actinoplanes ferrugineus]